MQDDGHRAVSRSEGGRRRLGGFGVAELAEALVKCDWMGSGAESQAEPTTPKGCPLAWKMPCSKEWRTQSDCRSSRSFGVLTPMTALPVAMLVSNKVCVRATNWRLISPKPWAKMVLDFTKASTASFVEGGEFSVVLHHGDAGFSGE